jgi:hypothetical protein
MEEQNLYIKKKEKTNYLSQPEQPCQIYKSSHEIEVIQ